MSISLIDKNFGFKNVLVEVALCSAKLIRVGLSLANPGYLYSLHSSVCFVLQRMIMWFVKGESFLLAKSDLPG